MDFSASMAAIELNRGDSAKAPKLPSPTLERVSLGAAIRPLDLSQPLHIASLRASLGRANVPNLYWLQPWLSRDGSLRMDGAADGNLDVACDEAQVCKLARARIYVVGARVGVGERASQPFSGSFRAEDVLLPWHGAKLAGQALVELSSARALLPLVTSLPIKDAVSGVLGLKQLRARLAVSGTAADYRLRLLEAQSGSVNARGSYRPIQERGALWFSTGTFNVGVVLQNGESDISLLVGDDWLAKHDID
jgi:hypothetical protein